MRTQISLSAVQKMIRSLAPICLVLIFALPSFAVTVSQIETLLISDVDDTLKVTHVLNKSDTFQNALRTDNPFLGMTSLLQIFAKDKENLVFAYVSNAPESLMYSKHLALLKNAKFPAGDLFCRGNLNDDQHKNTTIRALVEKYQPKNLILIGDNAEQDTLIYARAAAEFPNLNVRTYIHQLYSVSAAKEAGKGLEKNQIGYVTAADLALHWLGTGEIALPYFQAWANQILPTITNEALTISAGVVAFPKWMNCKDYLPNRAEEIPDILVNQYVEKRDKRCK